MIDFKPNSESQRAYGGRVVRSDSRFLWWYDVILCIPADAVEDVIMQICRAICRPAAVYAHEAVMGKHGDRPLNRLAFFTGQVSARILGAAAWSQIIKVVELLLRNSMQLLIGIINGN